MASTDVPTVSFQLAGTAIERPTLPDLLSPVRRSLDGTEEDPFLPKGFLEATAAYDLFPAVRGAEPTAPPTLTVALGQVVLLELDEGVSVITSAETLVDTLRSQGIQSVSKGPEGSGAQEDPESRSWPLQRLSEAEVVERGAGAALGACCA